MFARLSLPHLQQWRTIELLPGLHVGDREQTSQAWWPGKHGYLWPSTNICFRYLHSAESNDSTHMWLCCRWIIHYHCTKVNLLELRIPPLLVAGMPEWQLISLLIHQCQKITHIPQKCALLHVGCLWSQLVKPWVFLLCKRRVCHSCVLSCTNTVNLDCDRRFYCSALFTWISE